jgi:hypothetical protein
LALPSQLNDPVAGELDEVELHILALNVQKHDKSSNSRRRDYDEDMFYAFHCWPAFPTRLPAGRFSVAQFFVEEPSASIHLPTPRSTTELRAATLFKLFLETPGREMFPRPLHKPI